MFDEQLGDLGIGEVGVIDIEPESFGSEPAAINEFNVRVEVGSIVRHSAGV